MSGPEPEGVQHLGTTIALFATVLFCGVTMAAEPFPKDPDHPQQPATDTGGDGHRTRCAKSCPICSNAPSRSIPSISTSSERRSRDMPMRRQIPAKKYAGRNIRVIVASAPDAIRFAIGLGTVLRGARGTHRPASRPIAANVAAARYRRQDSDRPVGDARSRAAPHPKAERLVIVLGAAERDRSGESGFARGAKL